MKPDLPEVHEQQQPHVHNIPPVIGHGLKKVESHNSHGPGAQNQNVGQNKDPRHALQPVSDQGHKPDHRISIKVVILDLWVTFSVLVWPEHDFDQSPLHVRNESGVILAFGVPQHEIHNIDHTDEVAL